MILPAVKPQTMPDSRVYILGAGCSKDCGYPLGPKMKDDLERFGRSLDPATSPRLLKAVKDTVDLLVGTTDTVDILVQKLYGGHLDSQIGGNQNRHPCVVLATLATAAAFLAKEPAARQTGLKQYREFISDLFPGAESRWPWQPPTKNRHVLTFNYDRLFEMAFLDRFQISPYGLYDIKVLNSGVTLPGIDIEFEPENFSFLKLHGSVGAWTIDFTGMGHPSHQQSHFEPLPPTSPKLKSTMTTFLMPSIRALLRDPRILYFPFHRQFILSSQSGFAFDKYVRGVWTRAYELIANATEIRVIGYSFAGIDRGPVLDMIETASDCRRLIIQGPDAERICARLRLDRPELRDLIEPAPFKFWR